VVASPQSTDSYFVSAKHDIAVVTMKFIPFALASVFASSSAFTGPSFASPRRSNNALSMVLEKPITKKIAKIEALKVDSHNLIHPLKEVRNPASIKA
jgi:hypothetical protein